MKTKLMVAGVVLAGCGGTPTGAASPTGPASADAPAGTASGDDTITVVKCVGIARKGHNDCGALDGSHDCAGKAAVDFDPNEWVYVPEGPLCEKWGGTKLVKDGAVLKKQKPAKDFVGG